MSDDVIDWIEPAGPEAFRDEESDYIPPAERLRAPEWAKPLAPPLPELDDLEEILGDDEECE